MPVALRPTTELVAVSWVGGIEGITPAMVATTLPDNTSWSTTGFVQVYTVGGSPAKHNPLRRPVVNVDCWAVSGTTTLKPNWMLANTLAEMILAEANDFDRARREVVITIGTKQYPPARVLGVDVLSEPRRVPSDSGGYARYQFDMTLNWAAVL
jgi:hypothetical protein